MIPVPDAAELAEARAKSPALSRHQQLHWKAARRGWTRRQFLQMGAVVAGATGASLLPGLARAAPPASGLPSQIPFFSPILADAFGVPIPFFLPIEVDPFADPNANAVPTTIDNFDGFLGLVEADRVSDPVQSSDGVARTWACDVRFMKGVFMNRAGKRQPGAFAFF